MVHVDPQDRGQQVRDVLTRVEWVRRGRARGVAGGDVQHTVGAEVDVAAVVSALQEGEYDLLAGRLDPRRLRLGDGEPGHARPIGKVPLLLAPERVANE